MGGGIVGGIVALRVSDGLHDGQAVLVDLLSECGDVVGVALLCAPLEDVADELVHVDEDVAEVGDDVAWVASGS